MLKLFSILATALLFLSATSFEDKDFEKEISLGNTSSNIHIYVISNWFCGPCQRHEPVLQDILSKSLNDHQITYVDVVNFLKSKPFIPFNLSFLLNNKENYIQIRGLLMQFASNNKNPTTSTIEEFLQQQQIPYQAVDEITLEKAKILFESLLKKFAVYRTPTVVVANAANNRFKKLEGIKGITQLNIDEAITEVSAN